MAWTCMDSHGCVCKIATHGSSIRNFQLAVQKFDSMMWGYVEVSVEHSGILSLLFVIDEWQRQQRK